MRADASARRIIETNGLDLRYFSIIYDVIDQVKQVATGLLGMEIREEIIGTAQVRDVFRSSKFGAIAGCMIIEGVVKRHKPIRVLRDNTVIFQGELESLRRFKENVDEVRNGTECGIGVKQYNDAIELCAKLKDNGTRELLEPILTESEEHVDWLETQLGLIASVGLQNYLTEQLGGHDTNGH